MPSDRPCLSIIIPSYNGKHLLQTCLDSVERCAPPGFRIEVIVVDDASTDGTAEWLANTHPWVRLVGVTENGGFCRAANAGIAAASAPIIQLLNNDTEVTPGWAEAGLNAFTNSRVGSVAPLVLLHHDPETVDSAGDGYHVFGLPYKRGRGQKAALWRLRPAGTVFGASGSSAFYRAELLKRVGGFDPLFGSYYEDIDLAFRLRQLDYLCVYLPNCIILHQVSASYDHANPQLQRRMARNAELIFWRRLPLRWRIPALLPHLGFIAAQFVHRVVRRRGRAFLRGKLDALVLLVGVEIKKPATKVPRPQPDRSPHPVPFTRARAANREV
jgi:GT2 family glycosyltransferase